MEEIQNEFGVQVIGIQADVSEEQAIHNCVDEVREKLNKINILVNNAGMNVRKVPEELNMAEWDAVQNLNLRAAFIFSKAVHPLMKEQGGGKIINIGSMLSIFGGAMVSAYASSKGGLVQLTKCLACAYAPDNIQVNAILPGWFNTELTQRGRREIEGLEERVTARTPAGRWGEPEEIAGTAVYMASAASNFLTGVGIPVDGGYSIQM